MASLAEETLRALIVRMLASQSEIEAQNTVLIQRLDTVATLLSDIARELSRHGQVEAQQAGIVARLETALTAEATEIARLRALKIEGHNGVWTLLSNPKVVNFIVFLIGALLALGAQHAQ